MKAIGLPRLILAINVNKNNDFHEPPDPSNATFYYKTATKQPSNTRPGVTKCFKTAPNIDQNSQSNR